MSVFAAIADYGWRQALWSCFTDLEIHTTRQRCDCHGTPHDLWHVTDTAACYGMKFWHNTYVMLRLV